MRRVMHYPIGHYRHLCDDKQVHEVLVSSVLFEKVPKYELLD